MLHFSAAKDDGNLNLVVVFEKLSCLHSFSVHVVVIRLGPKSNLFQLLLSNLAGFVPLLGGRKSQFAVIEDSANRRPLVSCHLDQVQSGTPRRLKSFKSRHDAQLFSLGTDQPYRADADLLIPAWSMFLRSLTIKNSNIRSPGK